MNTDYTHISLVLDRSGSMDRIASDTIGGFNTFLKDQQSTPGRATLTLVQFNDRFDVLCSGADLKFIPPLSAETYKPTGNTALLDAIGRTIMETGQYLSSLEEEQRPAHVIFAILTDGLENASRFYSPFRINEMITHQQRLYSWEFVFLGANQDAITTAREIGIERARGLTFAADQEGISGGLRAMSANISRARVTGQSATLDWMEEQREEQKR